MPIQNPEEYQVRYKHTITHAIGTTAKALGAPLSLSLEGRRFTMDRKRFRSDMGIHLTVHKKNPFGLEHRSDTSVESLLYTVSSTKFVDPDGQKIALRVEISLISGN